MVTHIRRHAAFSSKCSLVVSVVNLREILEMIRRPMNLSIRVVDDVTAIIRTMSTEEYCRRSTICDFRCSTMTTCQARHTNKYQEKSTHTHTHTRDMFIDEHYQCNRSTEKKGRNVGDESSSDLDEQREWDTNDDAPQRYP
jgi:hypothetical protein